MPATVLNHPMVVNAVPFPFLKGRIGDLEHTDRARRWSIEFQRIPGQSPSPVCPCDRVAGAFHLRERGEQIRCDDGGRMLAEQRAVLAPGFKWLFVERIRQRKEDFRRFADGVIGPVHTESN